MSPPLLVSAAVVALLCVAVWTDLRGRTIPDTVSIALCGLAVAATWRGWHGVSLAQLGLGLVIGFAAGALLFYLGAMGGGDAKLSAGLGAVCGWPLLFEVLFATALWGGVLSLWAKRAKLDSLPYAPAFAGGYLTTAAYLHWVPPYQGLCHWLTGRTL